MHLLQNDSSLLRAESVTRRAALAQLALAGVCLNGCGNQNRSNTMSLAHPTVVSEEGISRLSKKTIFFGHQSVGYDIVNGMGGFLKQHPAAPLKIVESSGAEDPVSGPAFVHFRIGVNSDPSSKIEDFAKRMRAGLGDRANIAGFKFCYIDFNKETDVARVFKTYQATMADLAREYPKTRFVHLTVPLKATIKGWKMHVKNLIGRPDPRIADNLKREEFNNLLRRQYAGHEPLFDLAAFEATRADGASCADNADGQSVRSLAPEYTYDSGHLNERGRRFIGEQWLGWLAAL